jgi:site-specific DNA-adenine methylase
MRAYFDRERDMWSYYGSKSKIVHLYPKPKHDLIIEPFAGSARYALRYFDHDVLLVDKYQVIVDVWHYLQQASEADILGLPKLEKKERIPESLSQVEQDFLGFLVCGGVESPRHVVASLKA